MYHIGINFNNRGTTASCHDIANPEKGVWQLLLREREDVEDNVLETAVWYDEKSDEWCFLTEKNLRVYHSSFHGENFIAPMEEIIPNKKMILCAVFIRLVFERILKNHPFLKYDRLTGERNFMIYVSCPSDWNGSQMKSYKSFVSKIIPIEDAIKENVAVFSNVFYKFKLPFSSSILIIDIHSDIIDFSIFGKDGAEQHFERKEHGLDLAVKNICDYFEKNDIEYQEAKKEVLNLGGGRLHKDWNNAVSHYIKRQLDICYRWNLFVLLLDLSNKIFFLSAHKRVFNSITINSEKLENEILKDYRQMLVKDFEDIKSRIEHIDFVILTGEASHMFGMKNLLAAVFESSKVLRDTTPLHTVSDGMLAYAIKKTKMERGREEKKESCEYLEKTIRK